MKLPLTTLHGLQTTFPRAGVMTVLFPMAGCLVLVAGMMTLYLKAGVMTMLFLMAGYLVPAGSRAKMFPVGGNTNRGAGDQELAMVRAIWDPGADPACAVKKKIVAPPAENYRYHQFGIANNPELKVSVDVEKAAGATPEEPLLPYQELRKNVPENRCQGGHDEDSKQLSLV